MGVLLRGLKRNLLLLSLYTIALCGVFMALRELKRSDIR